ncbi:hypothetical protein D3C76_1567120 [compost metagenome]
MPTTEPERYTAASGVPTAAAFAERSFSALTIWSSVTSSFSMLWSLRMAATARSISSSVTCKNARFLCRKPKVSSELPPVEKYRLIKSLVSEMCSGLICPRGQWLSSSASSASSGAAWLKPVM